MLSIRDLVVAYGGRRSALRAVDEVSLEVSPGETLGVIGESGSGKTTLAKAVAGLVPAATGRIELGGNEVTGKTRWRGGRSRRPQMIFQDPLLALNPRLEVWRSVAEPLSPNRLGASSGLRDEAVELLRAVGIDPSLADRRPLQMSGGQRQRVTIARAMAAHPPLILCDEPVAALDISLQAEVLRLLAELRAQRSLTYLFISHDLGSIARLADRVGVMYLGQLVELGPAASVLREPRHPYTHALMSAIPKVAAGARKRPRLLLEGEIADPRRPPSGCRFRTRCPFATERCAHEAPRLRAEANSPEHQIACHFWEEIQDGTHRPATRDAVPSVAPSTPRDPDIHSATERSARKARR